MTSLGDFSSLLLSSVCFTQPEMVRSRKEKREGGREGGRVNWEEKSRNGKLWVICRDGLTALKCIGDEKHVVGARGVVH